MNRITHIQYRGDFYEITFTPDGEIVEVMLIPGSHRRGELLAFYTLSEPLQNLINEAVGNTEPLEESENELEP